MEDLEIKQEIERTIIAFFTEMNGWEIYCEDIDNNPDLSEKEKTLCRDFAIDRTPPICVIDPIKVTEKGFQVQTICEDNIDFAKILLYKNGSLYKESKNQKSSWEISFDHGEKWQLKIFDTAGNKEVRYLLKEELEKELDEASSTNKNDKKKIKDLKAQIKDLSKYKEDEAAFEKEKEKYYEEVVFSDQAPDIQQYKTYYESIDPENAEVLYKQVVEQITYDSQVEDYAKTYSNMKPQEAASIFDTMTDNLGLVADILMNMGTQQRADILGKMDATTAAKLTEIMEPTKKK